MPAGDVQYLPRSGLLTFEEIERFVRLMVPLGVSKVRLTGGEPLVRRDLPVLIQKLLAIEGIHDLGLTTNGILLAEQGDSLYAAGLRRLNISLDALNPQLFEQITRRSGYEHVIAGIQRAREIGFHPIKINAVAVRGLTESEVVPFGRFARDTGCEVRFIEYMPLDADAAWERDRVLTAAAIREIFEQEFLPLRPVPSDVGHSPSMDFEFVDGVGRIGFIPSVSQPFCEHCNRFRLTADGKLRSCLFSLEEADLRGLLRNNATDEQILQMVRDTIASKWAGHHINSPDFVQPPRPMHSIGG